MSRLFTCCLFLSAIAACDHATNATHNGPPLATVHGQMSLGSGANITGPVRLALAWYPLQTFGINAPPDAVIPQNVAYTGSFPQSYSLDVYDPPPLSAQFSNTDGSHLALGLLIAYQDGNSNDQLDTSTDGPLVDTVLGTSAGQVGPFDARTADGWFVVWSDAQTATAPKGFSLDRVAVADNSNDTLAIDGAQVPLILADDPRQGLWLCGETWDTSPQSTNVACGLTRDIAPPLASIYATITANGELTFVAQMYRGFTPIPDTKGTLNGKALRALVSAAGPALVATGPETDWLVAGDNTVTLDDGTDPAVTKTFQVPQPFQLLAPLSGPVTVPFDVSWSTSVNAVQYQVSFERGTGPQVFNAEDTTQSTMLTVTQPVPTGTGHLLMGVQANYVDDLKRPLLMVGRVVAIDLGP